MLSHPTNCPVFLSILPGFCVSYILCHLIVACGATLLLPRIWFPLFISGPLTSLALLAKRSFRPRSDLSPLTSKVNVLLLFHLPRKLQSLYCHDCCCFSTPWTSRAHPVLLNTLCSSTGTVLGLLRLANDPTKTNDGLRSKILSLHRILPR